MARTAQANIRLDQYELAILTTAAARRGLTLSEYLRVVALEATKKMCPKCGGSGKV